MMEKMANQLYISTIEWNEINQMNKFFCEYWGYPGPQDEKGDVGPRGERGPGPQGERGYV